MTFWPKMGVLSDRWTDTDRETQTDFISERELTFTFAICHRPSVCLSSVTRSCAVPIIFFFLSSRQSPLFRRYSLAQRGQFTNTENVEDWCGCDKLNSKQNDVFKGTTERRGPLTAGLDGH